MNSDWKFKILHKSQSRKRKQLILLGDVVQLLRKTIKKNITYTAEFQPTNGINVWELENPLVFTPIN